MTYSEDFQITLDDLKEVEGVIMKVFGDMPVLTIVDLNNRLISISQDAQKYLAIDAPLIHNIKGTALVVDSLQTRLLVRFFLNRFKPVYPLDIFKKESDAVLWLRSIV